jgi:hypothetical protein
MRQPEPRRLASLAATTSDLASERCLRRAILDYRQMKHFAADCLMVDAW